MENLKLINGCFNPDEAQEVIMNIFNTKIHFHEVKNFGSQERFGKKDEKSLTRIADLKKSASEFLKIVSDAREKGKDILITSNIQLKLVDSQKEYI